MNSFNTLDLYIVNNGNATVLGRYVRESQVIGELTFRDCLVISNRQIEFFEMLNIPKPQYFEQFSKENREGLIQIISENASQNNRKPLECFLSRYNGIQYFGELSSRVMSNLKQI